MRRVALVVPVIVLLGLLIRSAMILSRRQQVQPASVSSIPPPVPTRRGVSVYPVAGSGRVIYARTADGTADGPADVWETDLETGANELLITHAAFPKDFTRPVRALAASPDGEYLALSQAVDVFVPEDTEAQWQFSGGGVWVWERASKNFRQVIGNPAENAIQLKLSWSPSGNYLLVGDSDQVWVYQADRAKVQAFKGDDTWFGWLRDGRLIQVSGPWDGKSVVYLQPLDGKERQVLFRWPKHMEDMARSPKGSQYAFFDGEAVYVTDSHWKNERKVTIPVEGEDWGVELSYNAQGDRLAVRTGRWSGEPHINFDGILCFADTSTLKVSKIAEWDESYLRISPERGSVTLRSLVGWLPSGKSILISGQISWGGEGVTDNREDRFSLYSYDAIAKKEKKLFDSGPGCLAITWYPGK